MEALVSFGEWLKERRKLLDLTQTDLANRVGCSVMTIRKIEADERRPSRQIAELLADYLEIAPEDQPTFIKVARAELRVERLPQNVRPLNTNSLPDHRVSVAAPAPVLPPRLSASLPTPPTP